MEISKNKLVLGLFMAFIAIATPNVSYAGLNIFDKALEGIGAGPSHKRIKVVNKKGEPKILANNKRYQIIDLGPTVSYKSAQLYAARMGGHLAIIRNYKESRMLYDFMISQGYQAAYFGLSDKKFDGNWVCEDGSKPTYLNWHRNQPDRTNKNLKYAMLYRIYTAANWKAGTCSHLDKVKGGKAFIIEWDKVYNDTIPKDTPVYIPSGIDYNKISDPEPDPQPQYQQPTVIYQPPVTNSGFEDDDEEVVSG